jgi:N-acetylmuramoyl-L-alanine amidase CwlA
MAIEKKFIQRNYTSGRNGNFVTSIVLHTYNGKGRSLFNWFNSQSAQVSAHYAIFKDGNGEQYVRHEDTAWHAGDLNVNVQSIGIEHQDDGNPNDSVRTDAMYETSAQLVADLCRQYNIPCRRGRHGILEHREVSSTGCPGGLNVDRIINRANEILNPKPANDNLYRVFKNQKQIGAYAVEKNAFDSFVNNDADTVTYNGNNLSLNFANMANKLEDEIKTLKEEVKNRDKTIENTLRELEDAKELNEIFQSRIGDLESEIKQLKNPSVNHFNLLLFFYESIKKLLGKRQ